MAPGDGDESAPGAAGPEGAGADRTGGAAEPAEPAEADEAALAAFARARKAARDRGLRPGSPASRRRVPRGTRTDSDRPASRRDPELLGDQLDRLLLDRGWNADVAVGSVMGRWPAIVGAQVAEHSRPVTFEDGVLTVRAESTAWATQLRLLSSSILGRLEAEVGAGVVQELRIQGPSAPSWSRGPRRARGPGPRDTYG
ncbi:MAG TPA: DciA family protein [Segeticoccus sp.]|nr:DciA family protein [Segeticoccus sp.]